MSSILPHAFDLAALKGCSSPNDLAELFGTSKQNLLFHLYSKKRPAYAFFEIPKAAGGFRQISVPPFTLKLWQQLLVPALDEAYKRKSAVHGFVENYSICSNAHKHVGRSSLLNLDLVDFFPSIHFGRIRGVFCRFPFDLPQDVASMLSQLCSWRGCLPQGAPTSPVLSNLVCRRLDNDLTILARRNRCTYTRFADDLTFSTNARQMPIALVQGVAGGGKLILGQPLLDMLGKHKFRVNEAKTRLQERAGRQVVTGLVVNKRVNVERAFIRDLRAMLRNWRVHGQNSTEAEFWARDLTLKTRRYDPPSLASYVRGKLAYLHMVRGKGDEVHARYAIEASKLTGYFPRSAMLEGASATVNSFLREAIWIVAGCDSHGACIVNGTAFQLEGIGFVSALHVVHKVSPAPQLWKLIRGCPPHDDIPIKGYRYHPSFDLTVLDVRVRSHAILRRTKHKVISGAQLTILGFPSWQTYADELLQASTTAVQLKKLQAALLVSVNYPLLSGASGGPVLDRAGHVCGVIIRNKDDATMPNSFISIEHIDTVSSAAVMAL